ncbi:MAG TPA: ABC transporter permease [Acidimicrobiales bacterium]|nr:ABC transporter permease [Acidimicrobiales bacterium]
MSVDTTSAWSPRWAINDTVTIARRNLLAIIRIPTALVFAIIQPIMFVVLFRYVFGGAIKVATSGYVNYLIPGILVQTTIFGAVGTAIGLAEDLQRGLIERFRALPMARMAVLGGRTLADVVRNVLVIIVITIVGFAVGFRPTGSVVSYVGAALLMLLFAYCLSWGFAFIGLVAPNSEAAQAITFPLIFPITFASSIFVPIDSMPSWLRGFATYQPVSQVTNAVRGLMNGVPHGASTWISLAWSLGAIVMLAPLAVRRYRQVA